MPVRFGAALVADGGFAEADLSASGAALAAVAEGAGCDAVLSLGGAAVEGVVSLGTCFTALAEELGAAAA